MMVMVPRIATVSYLNTIPFVYGIQHEGSLRAELLLSPPSECAANFISGKADIALVPSAVVPTLVDAEIITNYCIGSSGPVRTVVLAGNAPIGMARRVFLDSHSLTSVQLAKFSTTNLNSNISTTSQRFGRSTPSYHSHLRFGWHERVPIQQLSIR